LPVDRSTYHYRSKRSGQAILMKRIKAIAETRYVMIRQQTYPCAAAMGETRSFRDARERTAQSDHS